MSVISELRNAGYQLDALLRCSKVARSTYYYCVNHPKKKTRPELRNAVIEIFSRTPNGCGHRQIAMCLRAELGVTIADKTVLKMMKEIGLRCEIRKESIYHRYNSYKGIVGKTFENIIDRNFKAKRPWEKLGTDVTEFKVAGRKAYLAPILDFCTKEIVAWNVSEHPNMHQQMTILNQLISKLPKNATPILHSNMGWQYQHKQWTDTLAGAGITQSMSRKGNCIDNAATEQLFGHIKDEFYRNQTWETFQDFKNDLNAYIIFWNERRRQVKLNGLTPEESRESALAV